MMMACMFVLLTERYTSGVVDTRLIELLTRSNNNGSIARFTPLLKKKSTLICNIALFRFFFFIALTNKFTGLN